MIEHDVVERRFTYSATTYHIPFKVPEQTDFAIGTDGGVLLNPSPSDASLWRCPELATSKSSLGFLVIGESSLLATSWRLPLTMTFAWLSILTSGEFAIQGDACCHSCKWGMPRPDHIVDVESLNISNVQNVLDSGHV